MRLRSGSRFVLSDDLLREIESYPHELCSIGEIRKLAESHMIVSVGDYTTMVLNSAGIDLKLSVVDLKTKRSEDGRFTHVPGSIMVKNEKSTLSHDLFIQIERSTEMKNTRIEVDGEEDLAVIPIIYYYDVDTVVCYGVPDRGMACITITPQLKKRIGEMMERMSVSDG